MVFTGKKAAGEEEGDQGHYTLCHHPPEFFRRIFNPAGNSKPKPG